MTDGMSTLYQDLLSGSYDCVDRIVLNAYFRMGHDPAGFRLWWRQLTGSDETLENVHLMRLAGRFSRRIHGYAKGHNIPVVNCSAGDRKHDIAEEHLAKTSMSRGLFLVLVGRAQAPVWDVSTNHHIEKKKPMPYVNHHSFHILDPDWGHITIKISGHPPFPAQIILNGHEYVACQARKAGIAFTKHGNCFTHISDPAALAKIAETLSDQRTIGRLSQLCDRWIYSTCLCFALDLEEQRLSRFHYQYSNYQIEYSRNLIFEVGGHMEQVFQALIDRSRARLDLKAIKTILGYRRRPSANAVQGACRHQSAGRYSALRMRTSVPYIVVVVMRTSASAVLPVEWVSAAGRFVLARQAPLLRCCPWLPLSCWLHVFAPSMTMGAHLQGFCTCHQIQQFRCDLRLTRLPRVLPQSGKLLADIVMRGFHPREAGSVFARDGLDRGLSQ
jgi:hypothetical protein